MNKAVEIIRKGCPYLANLRDAEADLDMDEINEETLRELYDLIKSFTLRTREFTWREMLAGQMKGSDGGADE